MSNLQIPGLLSGLSTDDIISKMMSAERMPLQSLKRSKDLQKQRSDVIMDINTRLSSLLTAIQKLNLRSSIDVKSVTTDTAASAATILTASATSDAANGSFSVKVNSLATSTTVISNVGAGPVAIGKAVLANQALASAGFGVAPTTGKFTVNGAEITIDATTVLSDGADIVGANTIFAKIRDATSGLAADKRVTVSLGLDANGRQNRLVLTATGAIQLGSGADTSNFLTAAGLAALPSATTMTSARNLGAVSTSALLNSASANLDVALGAATGTFSINGVSITYDSAVDTLNTVIGRINSSAANVTASYDSTTDQFTLTAKNTGASTIDLQDVAGNFLAVMKLSEGNETVGQNASYTLNGAVQPRYSTSNTVTDALPGVTLKLAKSDPATTVTLTVSQDTSSAVASVQAFVNQYNSAMTAIRDKTSYDETLKQGGLLLGDPIIMGIQRSLASLVSGLGDGLSSVAQSLSDVGISTGAVGTAVGQTKTLLFDSTKLVAKLQSNPSAVADLFGALGNTITLVPAGTGSVASFSGVPDRHTSGTYSIVSNGLDTLTSTFTPSGGGSPVTTIALIQAGGNNTTLIPGLMLTAKAVLVAGTDTITAAFTTKGVGTKITDYLKGLTSGDGLLDSSQDSISEQTDALNKKIEQMEQRLDNREKTLRSRFAALEAALARLQGQGSTLSAQLAKLD